MTTDKQQSQYTNHKSINTPLTVLYKSDSALVIQTTAGVFDKFADDDIYGEYNLGLHVADQSADVLARRAALLNTMNDLTGGRVDSIHWLNQVHGNTVHTLNAGNAPGMIPVDADALVSHNTGQALAIMTADCVPVALISNEGAVACIHAGWQGLTNGIIAKTFSQLTDRKQGGSDDKSVQISAVIGACISQTAYEITDELAMRIITEVTVQDLVSLSAADLWAAIIMPSVLGGVVQAAKVRIDIQKLARLQLEKLAATVINDDIACSYDEPHLYSYRAQTHAAKPATGRMALLVVRI